MTLANGRDLALIYFILIAFIVTLIPGALLGGMAYGLRLLKRKSIPYFKLAQRYARRTAAETDRIATLAVRPLLRTAATSAQVEYHTSQLFNHIFNRLTQKEPSQK